MTGATAEPLFPDTVALSPQGRLALVYEVASDLLVGNADSLAQHVTLVVNSAVWLITTGQADAWAGARSYEGYEIVLSGAAPAPPFVEQLFTSLPATIDGRAIQAQWQHRGNDDPRATLQAVEEVLAGLLQSAAQEIGHGVMLWATHVGEHRLAGLQAITTPDGDSAPYRGVVPDELDGGIAAHKLIYYEATGRAWLSLQFRVLPDGSYLSVPDTESVNPWARPIPDEAWDAERRMFPAR